MSNKNIKYTHMKYSINLKQFLNVYFSIIFRRIKWFIIIAPIFLILGIVFLILNFTINVDFLLIAIVMMIGGTFILSYLAFLLLRTKSKFVKLFYQFSNNQESYEYQFSVDNKFVHAKNFNINMESNVPLDQVGEIHEFKQYYLVVFRDNTNTIVPNNERAKEYIDKIREHIK